MNTPWICYVLQFKDEDYSMHIPVDTVQLTVIPKDGVVTGVIAGSDIIWAGEILVHTGDVISVDDITGQPIVNCVN